MASGRCSGTVSTSRKTWLASGRRFIVPPGRGGPSGPPSRSVDVARDGRLRHAVLVRQVGLLLASGDAAPDGQDVLALEAARLRVAAHDVGLRREGVLRLRLGLLLLFLLLGLVVGGDEGSLALGADAHVD